MSSGIYQIKNEITGRLYIGSSKNIAKRWLRHMSELRCGTHHSIPLQRASKKYGIATMKFSILLYCEQKDLYFYEQRALDIMLPKYNVSKIANRPEHTIASRKKMSDNCKKAWNAPGRREAWSEKLKGKSLSVGPLSIAHKQKLSVVHRKRCSIHFYAGKLWSLKDLSETYKIHYGMLKDRMSAGWNISMAVDTPKRIGGL